MFLSTFTAVTKDHEERLELSHPPATMLFEHEPPASFPESQLIKHIGTPIADCLDELQKHLNTCTVSVHSKLRCGTIGLLATSMDSTLFSTVCATTFTEPVNIVAYPTVPTVATAPQISRIDLT